MNWRAQQNLRLQKLAEYWVRQVPDRELVRKCVWDQAEREGLQFDRKEINAALRRAWNRTPDEERDALMAAATAAEPTSGIAGASSSYVPPGRGQRPGRESRPGPGGLHGGGEGCAPIGAVPDFGAREAETYELLARHEAGLLRPHPVALGPMPAGASESIRAVAADIALLIGLRLAVDDDRPLIYSARFCAWRMGWRILSGTGTRSGRTESSTSCWRPGSSSGSENCRVATPGSTRPRYSRPWSDQDQAFQLSASSPSCSQARKSASRQLWTMHRPF